MTEKALPLTEAFFYILLAVRKPNHGYGIILEVEKLTGGRVTLGAGTLYGAIQTMLKRNWIRTYRIVDDARQKKEYLITAEGRRVFLCEKARLEELLQNALLMPEEEENDND